MRTWCLRVLARAFIVITVMTFGPMEAGVAAQQRATPLALAAGNGRAAVVERLLKGGADPDTAWPGGETVLMTAARAGRVDAVRVLLVQRANVNARETTRGQTA